MNLCACSVNIVRVNAFIWETGQNGIVCTGLGGGLGHLGCDGFHQREEVKHRRRGVQNAVRRAKMAECIEYDVLLKALCRVAAPTPDESYIVEKCIDKIQGLRRFEVVRCEECTHCYQLIVDENGYWQEVKKGGTHNLCRRNNESFDVKCDDFCSYGERKDNA